MKRIPWGVILLVSLSLILGGSYFAYVGWFGINMYGSHPDMHAFMNGGGMVAVLGAMLIVMKWASGADSG